MKVEDLQNLSKGIESVVKNFEAEPWTDNVRLLREDFDCANLEEPKHYLNVFNELSELSRQARLLFIQSVFNKVCLVEGQPYSFETPYQAGMQYRAVMKKEGAFYLLDEDGSWREVFSSEKFMRFVDDQYWELVDQ